MSFTIFNYDHYDTVNFCIRDDFSDLKFDNAYHYVKRGDTLALQYYIYNYLETNKQEKRPDTPAKLIISRTPVGYKPDA